MLKRSAFLVLFLLAVYHQVQTIPQRVRRQRTRPAAFSFQSFDQSSGFPDDSSLFDTSQQFGSQLTSSSTSSLSDGIAELSPQVRPRGNEIHESAPANLPLYKQSIPGVYVKGHAAESLNKYVPTRQVAHHHGPNYNIGRRIASASSFQNSFDEDSSIEGNSFSRFN